MKKQSSDWTTHLGDSHLPSDDFTFTEAGNGGLDGFSFEGPYNEGILDGARLPESRGLSGLPDGIITSEEEVQLGFGADIELNDEENGSNFDTMLSFEEGGEDVSPAVAKAASLVNLDWLDPTQAQDPDRLPMELRPDQPPLNSVPALEAAWGSNEPTTGFSLVPAKDLEVIAYEESVKEDQKSGLPTGSAKTASEKQDAILRAVRRSHWGHDIRSILAELKRAVGDTPLGRSAANAIKADHGLAGKVFVLASAFPGIKNGRWVKEIRKALRTAKYVVTDDQMVADKLSMKMVASVPWGSALREYAPLLHGAGYKLASGNPKEVLRKAFLSGPIVLPPAETNFPEMHPVVASKEESRKELDRVAHLPKQTVQTANDVAVANKMKTALVKVARLVKEGRLTMKDAFYLRDLGDQGTKPELILKAAAQIMAAGPEIETYEGTGTLVAKNAEVLRAPKRVSATEQAEALEKIRRNKAGLHLAKLVQQKSLTAAEAKVLLKSDKTARVIEKEAALIIASRLDSSADREQKVAASMDSREYAGTVQTVHQSEHKASVTKTADVQKLVRWTRQQMSEGVAGKDLNSIIRAKYATSLLETAKEALREVRAEHEGLSGHLYVDASAYATSNGTEGCERGGLKHRGNSLKAVLEMPRCASCVNRNLDGFCSVYNKRLASEVPTKDPKAYQKEAIRFANAEDAEITASLFDPGEYNLQNNPMENVSLDNEVTHEDLGNVLFGGTEL